MKLTTIENYVKRLIKEAPETIETFFLHSGRLCVCFDYNAINEDKALHLQAQEIQDKLKRLADVYPVKLSSHCAPYPHMYLYYDFYETQEG